MKKIISLIVVLAITLFNVQSSLADNVKKEKNVEYNNELTNQLFDLPILLGPETPDDPFKIPNVDYSTGIHQYIELPWKAVSDISIALASRFVKKETIKNIIAIVNAALIGLESESPRLYLAYTQYSSKESYYSNYSNTYYHKAINLGICIYAVDDNGRSLLCGPYSGSWFDPVRP